MAFIYMESLIIIVLTAVLCLHLNNKRVAGYIPIQFSFRNLSAYIVYSLYINKSNNYTEVSVATYLGMYTAARL